MTYFIWLVIGATLVSAETVFDSGRVRDFMATREGIARARLESSLRAGTTAAADLRVLRARFPKDGTKIEKLAHEIGSETVPPPREVLPEHSGYRVTTAHGRTFTLATTKQGVTVNGRSLVTTNVTAYLASVERGLKKTFATAWWQNLELVPRAHASFGGKLLTLKVAAAAVRLMGLVPEIALNSMTARARATTTWFNQNTSICQQEADQRVPFDESETKDNVDQLAGQSAFARDGSTPVNCQDFVKRALAAMAPAMNDLTTADAQALCASAQAFSNCLRDYRRRDAGGSRIEPVNATPSGR